MVLATSSGEHGSVGRAGVEGTGSFGAGLARFLAERAGSHVIWVVWAPGYRTYKSKCEGLVSEVGKLAPNWMNGSFVMWAPKATSPALLIDGF